MKCLQTTEVSTRPLGVPFYLNKVDLTSDNICLYGKREQYVRWSQLNLCIEQFTLAP